MNQYEHTLLLSPNLSEEEVQSRIGGIVSHLQEEGGILQNQAILGKRPLGYPIQKFKEAYVAVLSFFANAEQQEAVNRKIKEESGVIRFLPLTKAPTKERKPKASFAQKAERQEETAQQTEQEKTRLEDIDKQLEEIFNENEEQQTQQNT